MIKNKQNGFVALFSVIIISFILILVAVTLSFTGYFTRFNIFDSESKNISESLANACIEKARLEIAMDNNFTKSNIPIEQIPVDSDYCDYSVTTNPTVILAHGVVNSAHTYYWVQVDKTQYNIPITNFKEYPNLSPCP